MPGRPGWLQLWRSGRYNNEPDQLLKPGIERGNKDLERLRGRGGTTESLKVTVLYDAPRAMLSQPNIAFARSLKLQSRQQRKGRCGGPGCQAMKPES